MRRDQLEWRDLGQGLFRRADKDKVSAGSKKRQVPAQGHFRIICAASAPIIFTICGLTARANDQIQRPRVRLEVVFTASVGSDKPGCAHLFRVGLFALAVRNGGDVGSEGLGEKQTKVSETTDTDDAHVLGGFTSTVDGQGVVEGCATA